jgi:hypothetical protein
MPLQKNMPDRIKLILQLVVFSLATWLPLLFLALFLCMLLGINAEGPNMRYVIWGALLISFLIHGLVFVSKWKKLLSQEAAGEVPDMLDPMNITSFQSIILIIDIVLLVVGTTVFSLFSKPLGSLCFIAIFIVWLIDKSYTKKRLHEIAKAKGLGL